MNVFNSGLLFFVLSVLPICSVAQSQQLNFEHGVFGGVNISHLYEMDDSYDPIVGFKAGYSIEGGFIGRSLTLQSGLNYSRSGSWRRVQGVNTDFITEYISLPVGVGYYFNNYGLSGAHLFAGSAVNYLVKSDVIFNMGEDTVTEDYSNETTNFLYSVNIGAGSKISKGNLKISLRIQAGTSINDVYNGEVLRGGKSGNLSFVAGLLF